MSDEIIHHKDYQNWTAFIAHKIKRTQTQAAFRVNAELLTLYWEIGNSIIEKQKQNSWGSKIIDLLALDLAKNFPESKGFSVRNLKYMRAFAEAYPEFPIVQGALAQIHSPIKVCNFPFGLFSSSQILQNKFIFI